MKKGPIRGLHIRTSGLVREAADGDVIVIERRGEPGAEPRPLSKPALKRRLPNLTDLWRRRLPSVPGDSGRFLEEDR